MNGKDPSFRPVQPAWHRLGPAASVVEAPEATAAPATKHGETDPEAGALVRNRVIQSYQEASSIIDVPLVPLVPLVGG